MTYTNWASGEPVNYQPWYYSGTDLDSDYMIMHIDDGKWTDEDRLTGRRIVCEIKLN